jgi:ATP-dependent RNA helicase DDX19/DBP5
MSDSQATPSTADASGIAKSLEERLTFPDKKTSWADDVEESESATKAQAEKPETTETTKETTTDPTAAPNTLDMAQIDGVPPLLNGSGLDEPTFDVNVKLADMQADPNDPLYSIQSFKDLNLSEDLLRALSVNSFHKPSKIQERALPLLMKNPPQNFIGQSQSGTGKTAAFTLNMLSRIDLSSEQPQCLVLAPTRELARQIASNCALLGVFLLDKGLKIGEAIPNHANRGQQITGQIIVGTPGTVFDMIKRRQLDTRGIKVLTLDEADNMLGK